MIHINPDLIRQRPEGSQQPSWVWTGSSPTCYDLLSPPRSSSRSAPADRSAGGRIQSWSWALPSDSEGGRRGSTRSQTDWPPSDLPSPVLQRDVRRCWYMCADGALGEEKKLKKNKKNSHLPTLRKVRSSMGRIACGRSVLNPSGSSGSGGGSGQWKRE